MVKNKAGISHLSERIRKDLKRSPCRYCENLVTKSPPRHKWVGGCAFNLTPGPRGGCRKFGLAKCFQK